MPQHGCVPARAAHCDQQLTPPGPLPPQRQANGEAADADGPAGAGGHQTSTAACAARKFTEATALFEEELIAAQTGGDGGDGAATVARLADVHAGRAACLRRALQPDDALRHADVALGHLPTHGNALFQRASSMLDQGRLTDGLAALEALWKHHRNFPKLFAYLLQTYARAHQCGRAPVSDGYHVGDHVETVAAYPGPPKSGKIKRARVIFLMASSTHLHVPVRPTGVHRTCR